MYRKRPHSKSRLGCLRCKSRRIKCDQRKPQCSHCERYAAQCEYPSLSRGSSGQLSPTASRRTSISPSTSSPSQLPTEMNGDTSVLSITDLQLMQHWTLQAHKGFGNSPEEETFWQVDLPQLGYVHPYLLHMLLAMSSLHLSQLIPERKAHYVDIAVGHQSTAIPAYRHMVKDLASNMDDLKGRAMVSYASLTAVYALLCPPLAQSAAISQLSESFLLLRGAREVLAVVGGCTEGCTISSPSRDPYSNVDLALNPDDDRLAAAEVSLLAAGVLHSEPASMTQASLEAFFHLRQCFAMLYDPFIQFTVKRAVTFWIESVPHAYLEAVHDLQPGALIVLAHWCIMLKQAETYWYLQGAAAQALSAILNVLEKDRRKEIAWPIEVVLGHGWQ